MKTSYTKTCKSYWHAFKGKTLCPKIGKQEYLSCYIWFSLTLWLSNLVSFQLWIFQRQNRKLQKKALWFMSFSDLREPSSPLFKEWKILKTKDMLVEIQNCLYVHSFSEGKQPKSFEKIFQKCNNIHVTW